MSDSCGAASTASVLDAFVAADTKENQEGTMMLFIEWGWCASVAFKKAAGIGI